jgi:hypothetical protein
VFERCCQADATIKRRFEDLDIGLPIVRRLVDMQGGTIEASSWKRYPRGSIHRLNRKSTVRALMFGSKN